MRTLEYYQYSLKRSHVPEIMNNKIKQGLLYGGIKLIYIRRKILFKEITFGRIRILIPTKRYKGKEVTFLRPFKQFWNVKENWLTPNKWGKVKNPYLNIWCELSNGNYRNIMIAISLNTLVKHIYYGPKHKNITNHLNLQSKRFRVLINQ